MSVSQYIVYHPIGWPYSWIVCYMYHVWYCRWEVHGNYFGEQVFSLAIKFFGFHYKDGYHHYYHRYIHGHHHRHRRIIIVIIIIIAIIIIIIVNNNIIITINIDINVKIILLSNHQ